MKFINFIIGCIVLVSLSKSAPTHHNKYRCGKKYGKCDSDKCCSKYGWCGTSSDYCSISKGCQSEFGICDENEYDKSNKSITVTLTNKTKETSKSTTILKNDNENDNDNDKYNYKSISSSSSESNNKNLKWAGFRYSPYGVEDSFGYIPDSNSWKGYVEKMKSNFDKIQKEQLFLLLELNRKQIIVNLDFLNQIMYLLLLKLNFLKMMNMKIFLINVMNRDIMYGFKLKQEIMILLNLLILFLINMDIIRRLKDLELIVNGGIEITHQKVMEDLFQIVKPKELLMQFVKEMQITAYL